MQVSADKFLHKHEVNKVVREHPCLVTIMFSHVGGARMHTHTQLSFNLLIV